MFSTGFTLFSVLFFCSSIDPSSVGFFRQLAVIWIPGIYEY